LGPDALLVDKSQNDRTEKNWEQAGKIVHLSSICPFFIIMAALRSRCVHYIFAPWFLLVFFLSSPNLSRRILNFYHTYTHGVSLVI